MANTFPGVGHRYLVDFGTWKTQLEFHSETCLTYGDVGHRSLLSGAAKAGKRDADHPAQ
jgi:hypothetical protein